MQAQEIRVTFQPTGRTVRIAQGATVRDAAARAGIALDFPCGGQGSCGKCRVRLAPIPEHVTEPDVRHLPEQDRLEGYRLACQTTLAVQSIIEVPDHSLLGRSYQILEHAHTARAHEGAAPVRVTAFALDAPALADDRADLERLQAALGPVEVSLEMLREVPERLRELGFTGCAVVADNELVDLLPAMPQPQAAVAAFDVGTTTLVGTLHDAVTGAQLGRAGRMNPQTSFGDDVLARITRAGQDRAGLIQLHRAVTDAINEMLVEMALEAGIEPGQIYELTFSGNTTMQHLLLGLNPSALGQIPFVAAASQAMRVPARDLGLRVHPRARAYVFPVIGGFVGGDTVAGMVATELPKLPGSTLFVDIGTNGEIVARYNEHLLATSCAAGPAFEGARIQHGMRAAPGAIEEVQLAGDVQCRVIGNVKPIGLCGSGLIDLIAELLRVGVLCPEGLLLQAEDAPPELPVALRRRLIETDAGGAFVLAWEGETQTGRTIVLTQRDVRELQLGTGAVRAGIETILRRIGLPIEQFDRLLVAGAFGNYIRCENAQRMGLLPGGMPVDRIHFVGNTSLSGAQLAALSQDVRAEAARLARHAEHVDLSSDPQFYESFVEALIFPSPSVATPQP
jgi:uncharacterized 2Fe-2S/4Fe-4S cluster protein (DUF4445 family)